MRGHGLLELCSPSLSRCCGWRAAGTRALGDGNQMAGSARLQAAGAGRSGGAFGCSRVLQTGRRELRLTTTLATCLLVSYRPLAPTSLTTLESLIERSLLGFARAERGAGSRAHVAYAGGRRRAPHAAKLVLHRRGHHSCAAGQRVKQYSGCQRYRREPPAHYAAAATFQRGDLG